MYKGSAPRCSSCGLQRTPSYRMLAMTLPAADPDQPARAPADERAAFLFVKIPVSRRTMDPLHLREDQIDQALRAQGVGMVVGWGDSLGAARPDGKRVAMFIRVDISARNLDEARAALCQLLPTLDAPIGTEVHYTPDGRHRMDLLTESGWLLDQPPPATAHPRSA